MFQAGRTLAGVEAVARDIDGTAEVAEVDALDGSSSTRYAGRRHDRGGLRASRQGMGITREQGIITGRTHAKRLPSLTEMANVASFAASDEASAMTGTIVNLRLGNLDD